MQCKFCAGALRLQPTTAKDYFLGFCSLQKLKECRATQIVILSERGLAHEQTPIERGISAVSRKDDTVCHEVNRHFNF